MGSPSSFETVVPVEDLQRGSPTPSAPFRRIGVCVDGSEMGRTVVRHAAMVAAAFGAPLTILRVLETDSNAHTTR
jgi:K+-sensing histidine kinase KdpD